ncbi:Uncharacterized conserved protein [Bordetella bronchiseptica]|uniref:GFA family protein n=1 Tax=Bordetella bronchiseptica TaxID=518 RepID=UPI000E19D8EA|nr:GFA family protein [Bordetella bronchiseptica]SUW10007.1 Uncharacterized conserved protein [Bordetella bronchiseptica]
MLNGSCLCGRVAYTVDGPLADVVNRHCAMCRKAHGAAFRTRATVRAEHFAFVRGEGDITWYSSSPGSYRGFCSACGTPLLSRFDQTPDVYALPLGALDDDPGVKAACHVYVAHKAPWHDITDDLPRHPEGRPGH